MKQLFVPILLAALAVSCSGSITAMLASSLTWDNVGAIRTT